MNHYEIRSAGSRLISPDWLLTVLGDGSLFLEEILMYAICSPAEDPEELCILPVCTAGEYTELDVPHEGILNATVISAHNVRNKQALATWLRREAKQRGWQDHQITEARALILAQLPEIDE